MKFNPETQARLRPQRGWSLVELLFVMLIIVSLAGMIAAAAGPVKNRIARYRADGRLKALQTALAGYEAEYGGYPICENPEEGGSILYKTLYGDFNGNGKPDSLSDDLDDPEVKTFMEKLRPPELDEAGNPIGISYVIPADGSYVVVDNWGVPFHYANFRPKQDPDAPNGGGKYNDGAYDLWSTGNDPDPNDDNRSMWIKNW